MTPFTKFEQNFAWVPFENNSYWDRFVIKDTKQILAAVHTHPMGWVADFLCDGTQSLPFLSKDAAKQHVEKEIISHLKHATSNIHLSGGVIPWSTLLANDIYGKH